jgi:AraC-like DNA-binding protein
VKQPTTDASGLNPTDLIAREIQAQKALLLVPDPAWPAAVRLVLRYVHTHLFEENLTVHRVRTACSIADHNISIRFCYHVGLGIKGYILQHRIAVAKRLLHYDELKIIRIALETGFSSHSAFSKTFMRHVGESPHAFRRRMTQASS